MKVIHLRCEGMKNPNSITKENLSFSWKIESEKSAVYQEKYQIVVMEEGEILVWDSGIVSDSETLDIAYKGEKLKSCTRYEYTITSWNNLGEKAVGEAEFETAFLDEAEFDADWIEPDAMPQLEENPVKQAYAEWEKMTAPMLRGEQVEMRMESDILEELPLEPYDPAVRMRTCFQLEGNVKRARLYVTAHGVYEVCLNGKPVTDTLLNPGFTTYDKRIRYQVYEAENLLAAENAVSVTVADGWYKGKIALGRGCEYGEVPGLLMKLLIQYEDGREQTVKTDENWVYSYKGPLRAADLFLGEVYDATREDGDPSLISYDDSDWRPVHVVSRTEAALEAQNYPPVRVFEELPAVKLWNAPNGDVLVDFGQNLAGMIRVSVDGEAGEEVSFEHGETLDKDGNYYYIWSGTNKEQKDVYICKGGGDEIYQPRFTYHGFRYVRVKGGKNWSKERFTALAISTENPVTGAFHCSDDRLNRLQRNIYWSQRSNNIGIPTDCPTREKAGWTGDVVVYGATALFNQEMTAFYKDWLRSIRAEQLGNGIIQGTVPQIKNYVSQAGVGSLGWGDVILTLPWQLYQLCGEKSVLEENYEAMGKWLSAMRQAAYELPNCYNTIGYAETDVEQLEGRRLENQHYLINSGFHFGDWLIPSVVNEQGFSDGPMSAFLTMNYADTSLLAYLADLYTEISEVLGQKENARESRAYAKRVREAFTEEFVTADRRLGQEMQGNYILALKHHMVPAQIAKDFAKRLNELISENDFCLDTGFMSTPHLLDVLLDYGYQETAWKVLLQEKCPSWLYEIQKGATTVWENWNAIREDGKIGDCSFNHYAFGCVGDFMYRRILGIQNGGIGYDRILIAPEYDAPFEKAEGAYESARGVIRITWEKKGNEVRIYGSVPTNTRATICLPDGKKAEVENGTFSFQESNRYIARKDKCIKYH